MIRKLLIVLGIALGHFGIILALTFAGLSAAQAGGTTLVSQILVWTSRVLYFPIITLALFPREMFPGSLVYVPILLNSLLWGIFLYLAYEVVDRIRD